MTLTTKGDKVYLCSIITWSLNCRCVLF